MSKFFVKAEKAARYYLGRGFRLVSPLISDEKYIKMMYRIAMGKKLDLDNPKTYNEKLQWLKLYDRNPLYTQMVDKYAAKEYVAKIIGEEHIIPTLGIYDSYDDINFDDLPDKFVLKCTHNSGFVSICKDKSTFDIEKSRKKLTKGQKQDYYRLNREWPYKNVPRRIIAEQFMVDESGTELKDYKFFCFNGEPKMLFIATDRPYDTRFDFFDMDFNHLPFVNGHPNASKPIVKPKGFDEMVGLSKKLSKGFPHVRVDLYDINGKIYFGELTFYHYSGFVKFEPEEWDYRIGDMLKLPEMQQ